MWRVAQAYRANSPPRRITVRTDSRPSLPRLRRGGVAVGTVVAMENLLERGAERSSGESFHEKGPEREGGNVRCPRRDDEARSRRETCPTSPPSSPQSRSWPSGRSTAFPKARGARRGTSC